jgi:hypothetical protein
MTSSASRITFFIFFVLFGSSLVQGKTREVDSLRCYNGRSFIRRVKDYTIRIVPTGNPDWGFCKVIVKNSSSARTITSDWSVAVLDVSGKDLNGDGIPDLVLETYTGGMHCCWNYWVVALANQPKVVLHLYNERGADFAQTLQGRPIIETLEGGYDYLRTSHAASFFPAIYLQLDGNKLFDISCDFTSEFDKQIRKARAEVMRLDPKNEAPDTAFSDLDEDVRYNILAIVSSYLYSNRPGKAWRALETFWPKDDRAALKKELLKIRREGVLKQAVPKPCSQ